MCFLACNLFKLLQFITNRITLVNRRFAIRSERICWRSNIARRVRCDTAQSCRCLWVAQSTTRNPLRTTCLGATWEVRKYRLHAIVDLNRATYAQLLDSLVILLSRYPTDSKTSCYRVTDFEKEKQVMTLPALSKALSGLGRGSTWDRSL